MMTMVVATLVGLHFPPTLSIGDYELRVVDVLSDVTKPRGEESASATAASDLKSAYYQGLNTEQAAITEGENPTDSLTDSIQSRHPLSHFFSRLDSARLRPVRIAYFGDSFIEGDILTSALRELLQQEYGGRGVGWTDIQSSVAGFRTTVLELSQGWDEHNVVGVNSSGFDMKAQGISGRYYTPNAGAYIDLRGQKRVYPEHLDTVQRATLYFTPEPNLRMSCSVNGEAYQPLYEATDSISQDTVEAVTVKGKIGRIRVTVEGGGRFYGMALESWRGISLDCFSMRGSVGWHIGTVPENVLRQFARLRQYDLIIMHFGLNMASPSVRTYVPYQTRFKQCIELYKHVFTNTSFLLVSMNDRDVRGADGQFHTMGGVLQLVEAQRQMAEDESIAFWNLQEAMGGEGSMVRLQQEGKANRDYTHINFRGGEELGQLFFNFLQEEKHKYDAQKTKTSEQPTN